MKKVLIIDDSVFISKAIKLVLESAKITVDVLNDSEKAISTIKKGCYDLVILDLMMPVVSGKDIFLAMKKDKALASIPVLILTAKADSIKWDPELAACDKYMTKPFDNKELLNEVKKILGAR